jgi:uncharacterized protein YhaN
VRLTRLGLTCYGHFDARTLELDPRPGCINLIVAPNGAGKSVLRQAVSEMLFGIHTQTPMGFAFPYPKMRLRAEAERDGVRFGFIRRKGDLNTLTDLQERPADAALLARLPRKDDRKRLERLFMLDSAQLRAGGRALMQSDGDLADALLSGAGELGSARALAADLAARRDGAAPTRKRATAPFYEACQQWVQAGQMLMDDAVIVRPAQITAREAQRAAAVAARAEANRAAAAAAAALSRLERIRRTRRPLQTLDDAARWLAANPDAPVLPPGTAAALDAAQEAVKRTATASDTARDQHQALLRALDALGPPDPALDHAAAIDALTLESGIAAQSHADRPKVMAQLSDSHARLAALLQKLGRPADPAAAGDAIRPEAEIIAARGLIQAAAQVEADLASAANAAATLRQSIADAQEEQASLPAAAQTERLKALLATASADGDPARQAEAAQTACQAAQTAVTAALARVPRWTGDAAALLALTVPPEAELTRLDEARRASAAQLAKAREAHAEAEAGIATLRGRLEVLLGGGSLPDAAAVAAARAHRDRGWRLIEARLAGRPGAEDDYDGGAPLPLAYARAVAAADAVADRRAEETERLAAAANLQRDIRHAGTALDAAASRLADARASDAQVLRAWAGAAAQLGLAEACSLAEARAFLLARDAAIGAVAARDQAAAQHQQLLVRHAAWAAQLAEASGHEAASLPLLLTLVRSQVAQADRAEARRESLAKTLRTEQRKLAAAEAALAKCTAQQAAWADQWRHRLAAMGRPADETPAATAAVLDALVALQSEAAAADTLKIRIAEMTEQLAAFERQAGAIATELGLAGHDAAALAQTLTARLKQARAQAAQRQTLQNQVGPALARLQAADRSVTEAKAALSAAITAAGATDLDAARQRVAHAAERTAREAGRAEALAQLRDDGDGLDVAALRDEAAGLSADDIAAAIKAAEDAASEAQRRAQEAAALTERIEAELNSLTARNGAADAALLRQAAAARLSRVLEEALVQHAAATMLEHALKRVEAEGGSNAKLARIGSVFAELTGGAYERVSPAEADKQSDEHGRLQAHERGGSPKHISQLSEGTRDQLYLALRIVAIEDHAASAAPLPFVADDILQTFDDTRALAALHALLALSAHTQIIVLTHHPHLAALAAHLPPGTVHQAAL